MSSLSRLLDWLLPTVCLLCGERSGRLDNLCDGCALALPRIDCGCRRCAAPLSRDSACLACLQRPPPTAATVAALHYASPVDFLIHQLKFRGRTSAAPPLGQVLASNLPGDAAGPQLVLPVPLHPRRLRERGFNQAAEISRAVCRQAQLDWRGDLVERVRDTPPQSSLANARERRANIKGAFRVSPGLQGVNHVAVVDDVMTTGSTVFELARCLRDAGVRRVDAWVVARATVPQASRLATDKAFASMKSRRGST